MAIYHLQIKNHSKKSIVAAAAYRAGEQLKDEKNARTWNYSRKHGVAANGIILCKNAPETYKDRATLWNSVQSAEKQKDARLAREFEVALPVELERDEQIGLVQEFGQSLADEGMIVDWALHDKDDGNPHSHILVTTRPISKNGKWGSKRKTAYALDADGNRIPVIDKETGTQKIGKKGRREWQRVEMESVDWNREEKVEQWRARWADMCNARLAPDHRIDHRSFERQGIEIPPTVHEGYAARQIEARGGVSPLCEQNRQIRAVRAQIQALGQRIAEAAKEKELFINGLIGKFRSALTAAADAIRNERADRNDREAARRLAADAVRTFDAAVEADRSSRNHREAAERARQAEIARKAAATAQARRQADARYMSASVSVDDYACQRGLDRIELKRIAKGEKVIYWHPATGDGSEPVVRMNIGKAHDGFTAPAAMFDRVENVYAARADLTAFEAQKTQMRAEIDRQRETAKRAAEEKAARIAAERRATDERYKGAEHVGRYCERTKQPRVELQVIGKGDGRIYCHPATGDGSQPVVYLSPSNRGYFESFAASFAAYDREKRVSSVRGSGAQFDAERRRLEKEHAELLERRRLEAVDEKYKKAIGPAELQKWRADLYEMEVTARRIARGLWHDYYLLPDEKTVCYFDGSRYYNRRDFGEFVEYSRFRDGYVANGYRAYFERDVEIFKTEQARIEAEAEARRIAEAVRKAEEERIAAEKAEQERKAAEERAREEARRREAEEREREARRKAEEEQRKAATEAGAAILEEPAAAQTAAEVPAAVEEQQQEQQTAAAEPKAAEPPARVITRYDGAEMPVNDDFPMSIYSPEVGEVYSGYIYGYSPDSVLVCIADGVLIEIPAVCISEEQEPLFALTNERGVRFGFDDDGELHAEDRGRGGRTD